MSFEPLNLEPGSPWHLYSLHRELDRPWCRCTMNQWHRYTLNPLHHDRLFDCICNTNWNRCMIWTGERTTLNPNVMLTRVNTWTCMSYWFIDILVNLVHLYMYMKWINCNPWKKQRFIIISTDLFKHSVICWPSWLRILSTVHDSLGSPKDLARFRVYFYLR